MEKYCTAGQAADDFKPYALCMLCTTVYKLTLRICNTYRFSTATMVARTRLNVTLYVHCLSFYSSANYCVSLVTFSLQDFRRKYSIDLLYPISIILREIRERKANWIGHILRRNCLVKQVIEGKIKGEMEVTIRGERRRKKLLDDLKDRRGYSYLKEEALDRPM